MLSIKVHLLFLCLPRLLPTPAPALQSHLSPGVCVCVLSIKVHLLFLCLLGIVGAPPGVVWCVCVCVCVCVFVSAVIHQSYNEFLQVYKQLGLIFIHLRQGNYQLLWCVFVSGIYRPE